MIDSRFIRQLDILQPSPLDIHIVGAGGIGSWTALLIAKLGYTNITVYDFDEIEMHNVATQFYKPEDLGKNKLTALRQNILDFTGTEIKISENSADIIRSDVLILAVDNMKSRKEITEKAIFNFCIDGRMGGEIFNIFSFPYTLKYRYEKTLFTDENAVQDVCTAKSICYNVFGIASCIGNILKRYDKGQPIPFELNGDYPNLKLYSEKF